MTNKTITAASITEAAEGKRTDERKLQDLAAETAARNREAELHTAIFDLATRAYAVLEVRGDILDAHDTRMRFLKYSDVTMTPHKNSAGEVTIKFAADERKEVDDPTVYVERGFEWCSIPHVQILEQFTMWMRKSSDALEIMDPEYVCGGSVDLFERFKDKDAAALAFVQRLSTRFSKP